MTEDEKKEIRAVVRQEFLSIIDDAHERLSALRDPTGIGRKALEGLANLIRQRDAAATPDEPGR